MYIIEQIWNQLVFLALVLLAASSCSGQSTENLDTRKLAHVFTFKCERGVFGSAIYSLDGSEYVYDIEVWTDKPAPKNEKQEPRQRIKFGFDGMKHWVVFESGVEGGKALVGEFERHSLLVRNFSFEDSKRLLGFDNGFQFLQYICLIEELRHTTSLDFGRQFSSAFLRRAVNRKHFGHFVTRTNKNKKFSHVKFLGVRWVFNTKLEHPLRFPFPSFSVSKAGYFYSGPALPQDPYPESFSVESKMCPVPLDSFAKPRVTSGQVIEFDTLAGDSELPSG